MIAVTAVACPFGAQASAWNPEAWHGEIITAYAYMDANEARDRFGRRVDLDIYNKQLVQTYGNLGLTDRIALLGMFDWQDSQILAPGVEASFSKPSSISAGLQYQISRREGHATALSVSYVDGIDLPDALITVESREPSVELRGLWGESRTVLGRNVFAEAQLAGRMTTLGRYASSHAQFTLGADPFERAKMITKFRYTDVEPGRFGGLDVGPQTRFEVEGSAVYRVRKGDFIELGYTAVLSGRSAVRERGWKIGFWTQF